MAAFHLPGVLGHRTELAEYHGSIAVINGLMNTPHVLYGLTLEEITTSDHPEPQFRVIVLREKRG